MSSVHSIRLQGPWEAAPLTPAGAPFLKIHLPGEVERLSYFPLGFRLKRRFHRPTGLTDADILTLTLPVSAVQADVFLNGHPLPVDGNDWGPGRWRIPSLEPSNILSITLNDESAEAWTCWREPVVLEIHPAPESPVAQ